MDMQIMDFNQRKLLIQKGLEALIAKWFPGESPDSIKTLKVVLSGNLTKEAKKGSISHVKLSTDKVPQHPLSAAMYEAGTTTQVPPNCEVVFSFSDEQVLIKPLNQSPETIFDLQWITQSVA